MKGMSRVSKDAEDVDEEFCGEIVQLKPPGRSTRRTRRSIRRPTRFSTPYAVWVYTVCGPIAWIVFRNARETYYIEGREP